MKGPHDIVEKGQREERTGSIVDWLPNAVVSIDRLLFSS
jgi:hypothetical protein